ncbi:MAG: ribosome small subunit-dependent GTPase A [Metamycoplasmataceae bacterium]
MEDLKKGLIVKIIAGYYDILSGDQIWRTRGSGNLRNNEISPLVGDIALFRQEGQLIEIEPRKNCLIRPKVANIDNVIFVASLKEPKFSSFYLDKFLMTVEIQKINCVIVFSKKDLETDWSTYFDYKKEGYDCFIIDNNIFDQEMNNLKKFIQKGLNVFTGYSGVGKTTLLNNIFSLDNKTQNISASSKRGIHTTRVVEIFIRDNIKIVDTPGFSSLSLELDQEQAAKAFKSFALYTDKCKFKNCLHKSEIDCEIKKQVEKGQIGEWRYKNYLKILHEIILKKENNF